MSSNLKYELILFFNMKLTNSLRIPSTMEHFLLQHAVQFLAKLRDQFDLDHCCAIHWPATARHCCAIHWSATAEQLLRISSTSTMELEPIFQGFLCTIQGMDQFSEIRTKYFSFHQLLETDQRLC